MKKKKKILEKLKIHQRARLTNYSKFFDSSPRPDLSSKGRKTISSLDSRLNSSWNQTAAWHVSRNSKISRNQDLTTRFIRFIPSNSKFKLLSSMHQFFYSPPDPLNRYLRFIREHRIKIKILHWDCILFTEFKASYILQLFQTILTFIPPNDTKLKWSLTRYIFDKRTTRFYPSLDPQNRNLNQNRTPFSFSPFPPPPSKSSNEPFRNETFVQLRPTPTSLRPALD